MRTLVALVSLLTAAGCGGDPLGPSFETALTQLGGCVDVIFYAVDAEDELMVTFRADGLVGEARAEGGQTVTTFELPVAAVELILERGTRVSDATCDDAIEGDGPQVADTWMATAGTATVRVRPLEEQDGARADLLLEDVVFENEAGEVVPLTRLEWTDVFVGWYPG